MADDAAENMIEPDTKDWTWVLGKPCEECGFQAGTVPGPEVELWIPELADRWLQVLSRPDVAVRPHPQVWSPLEYACHVRDVLQIFGGRVRLMLAEDGPTFENWDQDATALAERYGEQDPAQVADGLRARAAAAAAAFASVPPDGWDRTGLRSNGSAFTVESLGQYFLHDVVHHLVDVRG